MLAPARDAAIPDGYAAAPAGAKSDGIARNRDNTQKSSLYKQFPASSFSDFTESRDSGVIRIFALSVCTRRTKASPVIPVCSGLFILPFAHGTAVFKATHRHH